MKLVAAVGTVAVLVVGTAYTDAASQQDTGRRGSILDLMLHHPAPTAPEVWDWSNRPPQTVCYQLLKGTGTADDPCDVNPGPGFSPDPNQVYGVPPIHLKPGAACPGGGAPPGFSCDPAPATWFPPTPAPTGGGSR